MSLFTPINQKRLTNVSVIRLKKNGNRYEIACYPNKVKAWRDKLEKHIDEVLQTPEIFTNVSKGQLATKANILRDFNTDDIDGVLRFILDEGDIQYTGKERKAENQNLFRDVAKLVSEKCINPETHRAYTATMIEKMMRDCHINLQPKKSAKQQALEVIRQLKSVDGFKIAPTMLEIAISLDPNLVDSVSPHILQLVYHIIRQEKNGEGIFELAAIIEPENYHTLSSKLEEHAKNRFCIEVIGPARPSEFRKPASSAMTTVSAASAAASSAATKTSKRLSAGSEAPCVPTLSDLPEEEVDAVSLPSNPKSRSPSGSVEVEEAKQDKEVEGSTTAKQVTRQMKNKKRNKKNRRRGDDDWEDE